MAAMSLAILLQLIAFRFVYTPFEMGCNPKLIWNVSMGAALTLILGVNVSLNVEAMGTQQLIYDVSC